MSAISKAPTLTNPQNWEAEVALKTLLIATVKRMSKVWSATSVLTNTMDSHGMILKGVRYYEMKYKHNQESNPYNYQLTTRGVGRGVA